MKNKNMVKVSIVIPCFNEEDAIGGAIESLLDDFVLSCGEFVIVDGMSTDRTVEVIQGYMDKGLPVRVLENKKRLQCYAMNLGIEAAKGEIIVRVDAHSIYPAGYVKALVELLEESGADNVGGMMLPRGKTTVQQTIAFAMLHKVGVGDARFHLGNFRGEVDTVYLGCFRRDIFDKVGLYDTEAHPNEDSELNVRIRKSGGKIFLDSSIQVEYRPRPTFRKLALQYYRYGKGRAYTTKKHKQFTSLRQLAPPVLVLGLADSLAFGFLFPLLWLFWPFYLFCVLVAAFFIAPSGEDRVMLKHRLLLPWAFVIMHVTWGAGFLVTVFKPVTGGTASHP